MKNLRAIFVSRSENIPEESTIMVDSLIDLSELLMAVPLEAMSPHQKWQKPNVATDIACPVASTTC